MKFVFRYLWAMLLLLGMQHSALATNSTCGAITNVITVGTQAVSFGSYSAGSNTNSNGSVTVSCFITSGYMLPSFTVALSSGNSGSFNPRHLSLLGLNVNYNLYTTGSYSSVWGDGTNSTVTQAYTASANAASKMFTVFGQIPSGQFINPGIYGDAITVTVTF